MLNNPRLYEINTRVWIKQWGEDYRISEVPIDYFRKLRAKGFDMVWLMGIWKTSPQVVNECCFSVDLVSAYNKSLKDWDRKDVIGSPYAIDDYSLNPLLGKPDDLAALKETINSAGLKLIVDFVPNHFSAETHLISEMPELFLQGDDELLERDTYTFFRPHINQDKILAHGRDPLFPPWTDTVQVNYFSGTARNFMTGILEKLSAVADGVRCDMAMLPLNNIFNNTWIGVINRFGYAKPDSDFWKPAIQHIKSVHPDFIFLGEAYWDLEWLLQQQGFDFTYDKRLTDRLAYNDIHGIKGHLSADKAYQAKSVRFIENHDEMRAVARFGKLRSLAAATVISTVQGLRFYFDGQLEGRKIKLPLQLGRQPEERISRTVSEYYDLLLEITNRPIFKLGEWSLIEPLPVSADNHSFENFLSWSWKLGGETAIVIINYSELPAQCRIKFPVGDSPGVLELKDLLTKEVYKRDKSEITNTGLFVELKGYQSHIFSFSS